MIDCGNPNGAQSQPFAHTKGAALLDRDRDALLSAMQDAGELALRHFHNRAGLQASRKPDGSLYSEVDIAVNALLRQRLCGYAPDYGWLSEEDEDDLARLHRRRVWIVDPIDGSRAFLEGRTEFAICVALVQDGAPLLAALTAPALAEHYHAIRNQGAWCNGARLPVRKPMPAPQPASCRLLVSGRLQRKPLWRQLLGLQKPAVRHRTAGKASRSGSPKAQPCHSAAQAEGETLPSEALPPGSIAYRLMLVARGAYDATLSVTQKWEWDLAAAHLIAEESGVRCSACDGAPLCYNRRDTACNGVLAAPDGLQQRLAQLACAGLAQEAEA